MLDPLDAHGTAGQRENAPAPELDEPVRGSSPGSDEQERPQRGNRHRQHADVRSIDERLGTAEQPSDPIDRLGFDERFVGILAQVSAVLSLVGLLVFRKSIVKRPSASP